MSDLLEVFEIDEALRKFEDADLSSASLSLFQAMGYPIKWDTVMQNTTIENFIYITAQNKVHFNGQEMQYLKQIKQASFLCRLEQCEILSVNHDNDPIVLLSVELNSSINDRSEDAYYLTKILNKLYNGFIIVLFKTSDYILFSTFIEDENIICISDLFSIHQNNFEKLYELIPVCYPFLAGEETIKEIYKQISFSISRSYISHSESYEYLAYQCFSNIENYTSDYFITNQQIKDCAEEEKKYFKNIYGCDFVEIDSAFSVMEEEDDDWTLLEFDDIDQEPIVEEVEEFDENEYDEEEFEHQIDSMDIDKKTMSDPIRLLKWLEGRR